MTHKKTSLQDFKKWFSEQKGMSDFFNISADAAENDDSRFIGRDVRTKVGKNKLMERIEADDDHATLIDEFVASGGKIMAIEPKRVQIEVASGEFFIPRFCVKVQKVEE